MGTTEDAPWRSAPGSFGGSTAMAIAPTPACDSLGPPRPRASSAARAAGTPNDHSRTTAGLPFSDASERAVPETSSSEKSGAGNGSYSQVSPGAEPGGGTDAVVFPEDAG